MSKKETTDAKSETGDETDAVENATSTDEAEVSQDWTPESAELSFSSATPETEAPAAVPARKRGSSLLTWLALLLSLTALGAFAVDYRKMCRGWAGRRRRATPKPMRLSGS